MNTRSFNLIALALLIGGLVVFSLLPDASAHDGHKKGHAPTTAKRLRNPIELGYQSHCGV